MLCSVHQFGLIKDGGDHLLIVATASQPTKKLCGYKDMADVLLLIVGLLSTLAVAAVLLARRRRWTGNLDISRFHGTARIIEALKILQALNTQRDQDILRTFWRDAEPLLEVVMEDHTQDTRKQLIEALHRAHAYCRDRDLAKSVMQMRNALHQGAPL